MSWGPAEHHVWCSDCKVLPAASGTRDPGGSAEGWSRAEGRVRGHSGTGREGRRPARLERQPPLQPPKAPRAAHSWPRQPSPPGLGGHLSPLGKKGHLRQEESHPCPRASRAGPRAIQAFQRHTGWCPHGAARQGLRRPEGSGSQLRPLPGRLYCTGAGFQSLSVLALEMRSRAGGQQWCGLPTRFLHPHHPGRLCRAGLSHHTSSEGCWHPPTRPSTACSPRAAEQLLGERCCLALEATAGSGQAPSPPPSGLYVCADSGNRQ